MICDKISVIKFWEVYTMEHIVTIETRKGEEHVLRFYYYGSGRAYFTYNGSLGYTVYQSALKNLLKSCEDLMQGKQIPKF